MTKQELWSKGGQLDHRARLLEAEHAYLDKEMRTAGPSADLIARLECIRAEEKRLVEDWTVNTELLASTYYGDAFSEVEKLRNFAWDDPVYAACAKKHIRAFDRATTIESAIRGASAVLELLIAWREIQRANEQP